MKSQVDVSSILIKDMVANILQLCTFLIDRPKSEFYPHSSKKIAVIHDKGDYGKGLSEIVKKLVEKSGKAKVVLFEGVTPGAVDCTAIVQKIER